MLLLVSVCCDTAQSSVFLLVSVCSDSFQALFCWCQLLWHVQPKPVYFPGGTCQCIVTQHNPLCSCWCQCVVTHSKPCCFAGVNSCDTYSPSMGVLLVSSVRPKPGCFAGVKCTAQDEASDVQEKIVCLIAGAGRQKITVWQRDIFFIILAARGSGLSTIVTKRCAESVCIRLLFKDIYQWNRSQRRLNFFPISVSFIHRTGPYSAIPTSAKYQTDDMTILQSSKHWTRKRHSSTKGISASYFHFPFLTV